MTALTRAILVYGSSTYHVPPTQTTPLPIEFDFTQPEQCARKVLAVLSNASGGHTLRDCRLRYHPTLRTAVISSSGAFAHYGKVPADTLKQPGALDSYLSECITVPLGSVRTDQYGEGWRRAVWS